MIGTTKEAIRSLRKKCPNFELVENYKEAVESGEKYVLHHRLETHDSNGDKRQVPLSCYELRALGIYFKRPPEEFIFMPLTEHETIHHKGTIRTEDFKQRMSENRMGDNNPFYGRKHSEKTRQKWKENGKLTENQHTKGMHWFNDGIKNVVARECPEGFKPGRIVDMSHVVRKPLSKEARTKISVALTGRPSPFKGKPNLHAKGRQWFNNGEKAIMAFECPEGFVKGRLKNKENK